MRVVKMRSIVTCILLSIVTCGIYALMWMAKLHNDVARINGEVENGGTVVALSLLTCGIYGVYWAYTMGERIQRFSGKNDGLLYAILTLFGLNILTLCMVQNELNRFSRA
ncbi:MULTISPECIES: DUF4234 domain-containing protein [unclassified Granulicatella]|uniref:DUF4234 domain-containing protein n=1 Tax=unclassified Granulicatella TaxID=2630493 RepID=UPI001073D2A1|nr:MULTISPECIES: DUF4234 domain-containing protein [unclassified Granulicatella]MBF0780735.1 DUF4234 domain-containing protein [Granulicatella sp. 19428wC4_WM01]TFU94194.1 DUF4234 domain-containing protein [Granulicatella sp. WM01]